MGYILDFLAWVFIGEEIEIMNSGMIAFEYCILWILNHRLKVNAPSSKKASTSIVAILLNGAHCIGASEQHEKTKCSDDQESNKVFVSHNVENY
jgi:hypothetical protein